MFIIKHTLFIDYYLFVTLDFEEYTKRLELKANSKRKNVFQ